MEPKSIADQPNTTMKIKKQIQFTPTVAFTAAIAPGLAANGSEATVATEHFKAVHPIHVNVPEEALADLRQCIAATRCPDRETIADQSEGVQLAMIHAAFRSLR